MKQLHVFGVRLGTVRNVGSLDIVSDVDYRKSRHKALNLKLVVK